MMKIHVDHHFHYEGADSKLDQILRALGQLKALEMTMNAATQAALTNLNAKVAEETTVKQSVVTLLQGLSAQIAALKENQTDPAIIAMIDAASAIVAANTAETAASVLANTPVA